MGLLILGGAQKSKCGMLEGTGKFCWQKNKMKALVCAGFICNNAVGDGTYYVFSEVLFKEKLFPKAGTVNWEHKGY